MASVKISLLSAPANNNAPTILYDLVYEELGAGDANKTKKQRIRDYTKTILQHFAEQGYVKGFTALKR